MFLGCFWGINANCFHAAKIVFFTAKNSQNAEVFAFFCVLGCDLSVRGDGEVSRWWQGGESVVVFVGQCAGEFLSDSFLYLLYLALLFGLLLRREGFPFGLAAAFLFVFALLLLAFVEVVLGSVALLGVVVEPVKQYCSVEVVEFAKAREAALAEEKCDVVHLEVGVLFENEGGCLGYLVVVHRVAPSEEVEVLAYGYADVGEGEHTPLLGLLCEFANGGVVGGQHIIVGSAGDVTQD